MSNVYSIKEFTSANEGISPASRGDITQSLDELYVTTTISKGASSLESDTEQKTDDTGVMNDISREEFNAKLETIEVKMDARVESVSSKIDAFISIQAERDKRMEAIVSQIATNNSEIKTGLGSMKVAMVLTAVSTVIAIVFGVASFNATLTSNMFSAFQAGKSESASQVQPTGKTPQAFPAPSGSPSTTPDTNQK